MALGSGQSKVQVPASQIRDVTSRGEPMTVKQVVRGQMVAVQWFDEAGRKHNEVWFQVGEVIYQPPDSERWASDLRPVKAKLANQVLARLNPPLTINGSLPVEDDVDVLAGEQAKEDAKDTPSS